MAYIDLVHRRKVNELLDKIKERLNEVEQEGYGYEVEFDEVLNGQIAYLFRVVTAHYEPDLVKEIDKLINN